MCRVSWRSLRMARQLPDVPCTCPDSSHNNSPSHRWAYEIVIDGAEYHIPFCIFLEHRKKEEKSPGGLCPGPTIVRLCRPPGRGRRGQRRRFLMRCASSTRRRRGNAGPRIDRWEWKWICRGINPDAANILSSLWRPISFSFSIPRSLSSCTPNTRRDKTEGEGTVYK